MDVSAYVMIGRKAGCIEQAARKPMSNLLAATLMTFVLRELYYHW